MCDMCRGQGVVKVQTKSRALLAIVPLRIFANAGAGASPFFRYGAFVNKRGPELLCKLGFR
jgi:hypothetical protein